MLYAPSHPNITDDEIIKPMSNMLHANSQLKMFREHKNPNILSGSISGSYKAPFHFLKKLVSAVWSTFRILPHIIGIKHVTHSKAKVK